MQLFYVCYTSFCVGSNHNYKAIAQGNVPGIRIASDDTLWPNKGQIIVGNDVWIGNNVMLMGGSYP